MIIRRLKSKERRNILNLMRRIYDSEFSDNELIEWCEKSGDFPYVQWFVAESKNGIIGLTSWCLNDIAHDEIILMLLWSAVKKEQEGSGAASEILSKSYRLAEKYWNNRGLSISSIWVQADLKNYKARKFYKKSISSMGFKVQEIQAKGMWKDSSIVFICGTKRR